MDSIGTHDSLSIVVALVEQPDDAPETAIAIDLREAGVGATPRWRRTTMGLSLLFLVSVACSSDRADTPTAPPTPTEGVGQPLVLDDPRFDSAASAGARSSAGDPRNIPLPPLPPANRLSDTTAYLLAEGSPLLDFVSLVENVWTVVPLTEQACSSLKRDLESIAGPQLLTELAASVPDEPASDMTGNLVAMTVELVATCGAEQAVVDLVAWQWALVYGRLTTMGVAVP